MLHYYTIRNPKLGGVSFLWLPDMPCFNTRQALGRCGMERRSNPRLEVASLGAWCHISPWLRTGTVTCRPAPNIFTGWSSGLDECVHCTLYTLRAQAVTMTHFFEVDTVRGLWRGCCVPKASNTEMSPRSLKAYSCGMWPLRTANKGKLRNVFSDAGNISCR